MACPSSSPPFKEPPLTNPLPQEPRTPALSTPTSLRTHLKATKHKNKSTDLQIQNLLFMQSRNRSEPAKTQFRPRPVQRLKKTEKDRSLGLLRSWSGLFGFRKRLDQSRSRSYFFGPKNQTGPDFRALIVPANLAWQIGHWNPVESSGVQWSPYGLCGGG